LSEVVLLISQNLVAGIINGLSLCSVNRRNSSDSQDSCQFSADIDRCGYPS
jgi:hypothetical protein